MALPKKRFSALSGWSAKECSGVGQRQFEPRVPHEMARLLDSRVDFRVGESPQQRLNAGFASTRGAGCVKSTPGAFFPETGYNQSYMSQSVYLDHLIEREAFLYKSTQDLSNAKPNSTPRVSLLQLIRSSSERGGFRRQLRKPDFQRATWAWSPTQCVDLMDSLLKNSVVPSVILWSSPDQFIYVLDGGHRISVLLGYLNDDWGDKDLRLLNPSQIEQVKRTAAEVRDLLRRKGIASFKEHQAADDLYWQLVDAQPGPEKNDAEVRARMGDRDWNLATTFRSWNVEDVGFSIQWVTGNYNDAEESFLRINSSGTNLSDWEITLVRYRQSSFARLVTSLAYPEFIRRYWPLTNGGNEPLSPQAQKNAETIPEHCNQISQLLWEPRDAGPGSRLRPLLVASSSIPESQPFYVGELLTVIQGQQGQPAQTLALMRNSRSQNPEQILSDGYNLSLKILEALNHLRGRTVYSLGIVSAAYFYNPEGIPVRSLFYGFLFWITYGTKAEIQQRKEMFCAFRGQFEAKLLKHKSDIINRISRRIGSGGEVTFQTARYFQGLLELILEHRTDLESEKFDRAHANLLEGFGKNSTKTDTEKAGAANVVASRVASPRQRSRIALEQEFDNMPVCGICGGRLPTDDPQAALQFDHKVRHSAGGATSDVNLRRTHAFCNHRRDEIERMQQAPKPLPGFIDSQGRDQAAQLTFSELWSDPEDDLLEVDGADTVVDVEFGVSDSKIEFEAGDDN